MCTMQTPQPDYVTQPESEASLLLANIDSALRELEAAKRANGSADTVRVLERALSTYGSIKHLVPKLDLSRDQKALVEEHLQRLRAGIIASDPTLNAG
jgi:hypothetical protein